MLSRFLSCLAAGLLCAAPEAQAQPQLPEGPGKAVIEQSCLGCHEPARIIASRLQPPGLAERRSHDAERRCTRAAGPGRRAHRLPGDELPGEAEARAVADRRHRAGRDQGMGGADARFATARSPRLSGWLDLVHRTHGQRARPAGSAQREDHRIPSGHRRLPARTASSPTRTATSGSPATSPATSANSIRRPASSPTIRCPTRARATRTRRCSIGAACCGSPCRVPTWSAAWIPKIGDIRLVKSPTPRSNPYGMVISSRDIPWFCEFGANKLASIDPDTMADP